MSIQRAINQGISIAAHLITQKDAKETKAKKAQEKKVQGADKGQSKKKLQEEQDSKRIARRSFTEAFEGLRNQRAKISNVISSEDPSEYTRYRRRKVMDLYYGTK